MGKVLDRARKIFDDEHRPPFKFPPPYARRPQLSDLWECDQEKYIKRAERELGLED